MAKIDAGTEQSTLTESGAGRESRVRARKTTIKEYFCPLCGVSYSLAEEEGSFCMRLNSAQSVTGKELVSVEETLAMTSPREIVDRNFQLAAERLGLGKEERLLLKTPFREMKVEVPVRLDDGTFKVSSAIASSTAAPGGQPKEGFGITLRLTKRKWRPWLKP